MIYLLHGENSKKSREKLHSLTDALLKKEPDALLSRIDSENFSESSIEEFISSQTLFTKKHIVVLDDLFSLKENQKFLLNKLKDISKSENIFIFVEGKLNKTILSRFKKWAEKIQEFTGQDKKKTEFNIFSLTDAFGKRDTKSLWVLYQKARQANVSPEEIQGVLSWQAKNLLGVKKTQKPESLGLNPFVLRKTLSFISNFSLDELFNFSVKLIELPMISRRGEGELDILLEKFILSL